VPSGDFKMTFVGNNALNVLGYHPDEMVADPNFWFDHIHPDDAPGIFSSLAQIFVEGARGAASRVRGGSYLWMHDSLRLVRDEHGVPFEVIGSLTDITERKRMEAMLQARGEEQQLLISKLQEAHDQLLQAGKWRPSASWRPASRTKSTTHRLRQFQHDAAYVGTLFDDPPVRGGDSQPTRPPWPRVPACANGPTCPTCRTIWSTSSTNRWMA
jgi:PAS domain S-box-containing protein